MIFILCKENNITFTIVFTHYECGIMLLNLFRFINYYKNGWLHIDECTYCHSISPHQKLLTSIFFFRISFHVLQFTILGVGLVFGTASKHCNQCIQHKQQILKAISIKRISENIWRKYRKKKKRLQEHKTIQWWYILKFDSTISCHVKTKCKRFHI